MRRHGSGRGVHCRPPAQPPARPPGGAGGRAAGLAASGAGRASEARGLGDKGRGEAPWANHTPPSGVGPLEPPVNSSPNLEPRGGYGHTHTHFLPKLERLESNRCV
eukprot:8747487-Heterocapsa_arctica.AAC.1